MRPKIVFVLLSCMLAVFGASVVAPAVVANNEAGGTVASAQAAAPPRAPKPERKPEPPPEPRVVRVVATSWDVLAPGVVANDGALPGSKQSIFRERGIEASFAALGSTADVGRALALGGDADGGAHLAVVPLSTLAAESDRLRALSLRVVYVAAWSEGSYALHGPSGDALLSLSPRDRPMIVGSPEQPEAIVALASFDLAGVDAEQVRWVAPRTAGARAAAWAVVDRGASGAEPGRHAVVSTADMPRLLPYVIVAPASETARADDGLSRFLRAWTEGSRRLESDPARAARHVAAGSEGADPMVLVERLGRLRFVQPPEAARALGMSGRDVVTVDTLYAYQCGLLSKAGVPVGPAPQGSIVSADPAAALMRESTGNGRLDPAPGRRVGARAPSAIVRVKTRARGEALVDRTALVAGMFDGAEVALSTPGGDRARELLVDRITDRWDLDPARFTDASHVPRAGTTLIVVRARR
jgi:hypothetical protein